MRTHLSITNLCLIIIFSWCLSGCIFASKSRAKSTTLKTDDIGSWQFKETKFKDVYELFYAGNINNPEIKATQLEECNLTKQQNLSGHARQLYVLFDKLEIIESAEILSPVSAIRTEASTTQGQKNINILAFTWIHKDCVKDLVLWSDSSNPAVWNSNKELSDFIYQYFEKLAQHD